MEKSEPKRIELSHFLHSKRDLPPDVQTFEHKERKFLSKERKTKINFGFADSRPVKRALRSLCSIGLSFEVLGFSSTLVDERCRRA